MGGYLKWMKSLIGMKKHESNEHLAKRGAGHTRKWKLWRNSSMSESLRSDENKAAANHFSAVVNAIVRAPLKDFQALRKQWAAIRIQTYFRGFLARRALRALKAVVRIQALFRGQQVRKQAAQTLQCMESLIRAQIRVRTHRLKLAAEEQGKQSMPALEVASLKNHHELNNCNDGCNCLERYMEARTSERYYNKHDKRLSVADARYSDQGQKKNFITDDSSKVQLDKKCKEYFRNCLAPTSQLGYGKNSESTSIWTPSSVSSSTLLASEETDVSSNHQPNYMSLTESIKAKHMSCYAQRMSRSCGELRHCRRAALSDIEPRSSVSLDWRIQSSPFKERRSFSVKGMEKENDC